MSVVGVNSSVESPQNVVEGQKNIDLVQRLAREIFLDIAVAALFIGVALPYMVPAYRLSTLITTISFLALTTLLKGGYAAYTLCQTDPDEVEKQGGMGKVLVNAFTHYSFLWHATPRDTLIHEAGHAAAAVAVYKNARPTVSVDGFNGGYTSYYPDKLTSLGKAFGEKTSRAVVAGAGPAFGILTACADITIAHKIKESDPKWSFRFNLMAIANIANHCLYALSAFFISSPGHDFINLQVYGGVNPFVAVVVMIAIPVLVKLGLEMHDQYKNSHKEKHLEVASDQIV